MATDRLTPEQELAAQRRGGPILVSAAAGSGKTKVLVERLMRRILSREEACSINDFLIITFTTKAAAELRSRIARELAERLAQEPENVHLQRQQSRIYLTQISTVHAFCANLLREFAYELNIPADFRMLEETEAEALRRQLADDLLSERYEELAEDQTLQILIDGLGAGRDDRRIPELVLDVYQTAQCRIFPGQWMWDCDQALELEGITAAEQTIWGAYLIKAFREMLGKEQENLHRALQIIQSTPALEKYLPTFTENLALLERLSGYGTWDDLYQQLHGEIDFGKLKGITGCTEPELQALVKTLRSDMMNRIKEWIPEFYGDSRTVLSDLEQTRGALHALFSLTREFQRRYEAEKRRLHAMDFNDLEHQAIRLLLREDGKTPTETARRISARYKEIMVDEYQDTNLVQDSIFRAISADGKNRFMVGDVKQSIYRFRLADPSIFIRKYNSYPDASAVGPEDRQRILLSRNFRSGEAVLDAANAVFSLCMSPRVGGLVYGPEEALQPGVPKQPLPQTQVELHCLSTKSEEEDSETPEKTKAEAVYAARRIRQFLDDRTPIRDGEGTRPVEPGDIAILLRSPKNAAASYLEALRSQGIPASSDSGESVLDSAEVEALLCLLKAIDNVHRDIPLAGALLSPLFGISGSELAIGRAQGRDTDLYDCLRQAETLSDRLKKALDTIDSLRRLASELPLHRLLERIRQLTGLDAVCGAMEQGNLRLQNLQIFEELATRFSENGRKSLHQFLAYVEVLREKGGIPRQTVKTNSVTVMSIHKSKGLEFPVVLLCGLSKRFNADDQKAQVHFHTELGAGCSVYDRPTHSRFASIARSAISRQTAVENCSEELRILYVAMTRAQDMLIMTYCSGTLKSKLTNLAYRLTRETAPALAERAGALGDWILETAMLRAEAGALFAVGGRPEAVEVSAIPWRIEYRDISEQPAAAAAAETQTPAAPGSDLSELTRVVSYRYPFPAAAHIPAKLTATQIKGRMLDQEAENGSANHRVSRTLKPNLLQADRPLTPAQKGIAVHQAMQYLSFDRVGSVQEIEAQLRDMTARQFLTERQAAAVSPEKLFRVFQGEIGREIREAEQVIREFKFSVLVPAARYYPEAGEERLMLQGVTDCFLIRDGEITVIDFKTDRVTPETQRAAAERYRPQLEAYSKALSAIYKLPVTKRLLYFFATDSTEAV